MRQVIEFIDENTWLENRVKDITSTEVSALFGISPYNTPFELWHQKKTGTYIKLADNQRMKWGRRQQDGIAAGIAEDNGWQIRKMTEYIRDTELRAGSSFDFAIGEDGLLEVKNVDSLVFKTDWTESDEGIQAPLHIECQVQHQLLVSGREYAYIGALVGGNRDVLIKRTRDEAVIQAIRERVAAFWASIEANEPPPADYQADAEFIGKLFGYAEPGKKLDVSEDKHITDLAVEYKTLGDQVKVATERREAIKSEILTLISDAEKITGDGFSIDAGITGPAHVEYDWEGFRRFVLRWKKVK
jgi:putative phage-type endonuclease